MPHENRPEMNPPPRCTFDQVFGVLSLERNKQTTLFTTGKYGKQGVEFAAEAKRGGSGVDLPDKRYISLPHNNRIYSCCWGNTQNHMGKDGQRIGQYARPLDQWANGRL